MPNQETIRCVIERNGSTLVDRQTSRPSVNITKALRMRNGIVRRTIRNINRSLLQGIGRDAMEHVHVVIPLGGRVVAVIGNINITEINQAIVRDNLARSRNQVLNARLAQRSRRTLALVIRDHKNTVRAKGDGAGPNIILVAICIVCISHQRLRRAVNLEIQVGEAGCQSAIFDCNSVS